MHRQAAMAMYLVRHPRLWPIVAGRGFIVPTAILILIRDFRRVSRDDLFSRRTFSRPMSESVGWKCFRIDAVDPIGPSAVVFDDFVCDFDHRWLLVRTGVHWNPFCAQSRRHPNMWRIVVAITPPRGDRTSFCDGRAVERSAGSWCGTATPMVEIQSLPQQGQAMLIGIPKEIKDNEYRVGVVPSTVRELMAKGHGVLVEMRAGIGAGLSDAEYEAAGAKIVPSSAEIF